MATNSELEGMEPEQVISYIERGGADAPPAAGLPAAYNVAGVILGCEQLIIERARAFEAARGVTELRELTGADPDAEGYFVYAGAVGSMQATLTGLLILLDRLADAPGPCGRYNAHTPHGKCPGTVEDTLTCPVHGYQGYSPACAECWRDGNAHERAAARYEQAWARLRDAEVSVSEAADELDAAEEALAATESAPGIPLERYR